MITQKKKDTKIQIHDKKINLKNNILNIITTLLHWIQSLSGSLAKLVTDNDPL